MKIAIIGSGIAGLAASHLLQDKGHEVHLFESQAHIGMSAHTIDFESPHGGSTVWGDVPSRMFNGALWPSVTELYQSLGLTIAPIRATQSYRRNDEESALQFQLPFKWSAEVLRTAGDSLRAFAHSVGVSGGSRLRSTVGDCPDERPVTARRSEFLHEINRLREQGLGDLQTLDPNISFQQYLDQNNFSAEFRETFLFPALSSTVCTCSHGAISNYPAVILLNAMQHITGDQPLCRVEKGARWVSQRLTEYVNLNLVTPVEEVYHDRGMVTVTSGGNQLAFDHVIIATQANQVERICAGLPENEAAVLRGFQYEDVDVVVHTDQQFMPSRTSEWAMFNFAANSQNHESMCTVWMNQFHTNWQDEGMTQPIFQTIRPIRDVSPDKLIGRAKLQRPLVDRHSWRLWEQLREMHQQQNRRIWFCGSYAMPGIPLLESAVESAKEISDAISSGSAIGDS